MKAEIGDISPYKSSSLGLNYFGLCPLIKCGLFSGSLALGKDAKERQTSYRELFKHHVDGKLLEDIQLATNKGMALGSERFKAEIENLSGRRMTAKKMGRPVGWRKEKRISDI